MRFFESLYGVQRRWVHFLRELGKLLDKHPQNEGLALWVEEVRDIYKAAKKAAKRGFREEVRARLRQELETRIYALAEPYLKKKDARRHVLAKRIDKHLGELFTFVQYPGCPSGNNAAQRPIRPAVIARKISGGTRSLEGFKDQNNTDECLWNLAASGQGPATCLHGHARLLPVRNPPCVSSTHQT
ncbi:MAG: transposase [Armatimonadetes bacterium]|nr:transposase [Armatimonadota bacterium]